MHYDQQLMCISILLQAFISWFQLEEICLITGSLNVKQCTKYWHLYPIWCVLQCIWLCLWYSLQHLCSNFYNSLCGACCEKRFLSRMRELPPWGVCHLLCVRLPVINDCSASLTETATTKTPERQTKKRGGGRSERKGGNKKQHTVQASWSCGWLHWRIWGRGVERRVRVSENKRKRQKERERSERQSRVQPGLEARLCLCLGLIDFPENCCSRPLPSSLMKPSGIYHPTARPTPALHWLACPFIFFDSLLRRHTLTSTHTQSQTNVCMHTQAQREITCPTQATNKGSAKRMCRVVAFVYAHCLGFCLVAFLLYPRTKRRKN